jgi:hypothetical protein
MPLLVISSLALGLMTTRSPSGRSLVDVAVALATGRPLDFEPWTGLDAVAVAKGWFLRKLVLR